MPAEPIFNSNYHMKTTTSLRLMSKSTHQLVLQDCSDEASHANPYGLVANVGVSYVTQNMAINKLLLLASILNAMFSISSKSV
uniref:Uncharacterized protein n=1 Tax=Rhizophora mucronata TaxID=61149 RepID=A0A2P2PVG4_RHIMU